MTVGPRAERSLEVARQVSGILARLGMGHARALCARHGLAAALETVLGRIGRR
jgi:hypothetical protein